MPTSSATNNHTIQVARHRNPLHAYSIMIHWLKVYELILCSENNENGDCMDQGRSPIEANIRTCGRSEGQRRNKIYHSRKRKKIRTKNHASKARVIMQAVDKDETA